MVLCTYILFDVERPVVAPAEHNVTLGENVTFDCNEFGSPPFSYQWYMRSLMGTDILLVDETNEFYNIPSTMYNDTGGYFCEANNSLGILTNSTPADLLGKNVDIKHKGLFEYAITNVVYIFSAMPAI